MDKIPNAELRNMLAEQQKAAQDQQEKYNNLTKLLEKQLEAQNSQQQLHAETIRQMQETFQKQLDTLLKLQEANNKTQEKLLGEKKESAIVPTYNFPANFQQETRRWKTDWKSLIIGTYEFGLVNSNLLEKQALWMPPFRNKAPMEHLEWISGNKHESFADFKEEYLNKWAEDFQLLAQSEIAVMRQGNKEILQYITEIVDLARASATPSKNPLLVKLIKDNLSESYKKTFEKAADIDTLWHLALQNQQKPQPRYTQRYKPFDKDNAHSRNKKSLKQDVSTSNSCINHPNSNSHTTAQCKNNTKKEALKCDNCPHLSNHTTSQCKRKPKTLIMESPSREPITGTMTIALSGKSTQVEYTLDTGASYTTINSKLHQQLGQPIEKHKEITLGNGHKVTVPAFQAKLSIDEETTQTEILVLDLPPGTSAVLGLNDASKYYNLSRITPQQQPKMRNDNEDDKAEYDKLIETNQLIKSPSKIPPLKLQPKSNIVPNVQFPARMNNEATVYYDNLIEQLIQSNKIEPSTEKEWNTRQFITAIKRNANGKIAKARIAFDGSKWKEKFDSPNEFIPKIQDLLQQLADTEIFNSIDLETFFWQIELEESSRDYTTFTHNGHKYRWVVCPNGINAISGHVSRHLPQLLAGTDCIIYLDDICQKLNENTKYQQTNNLLRKLNDLNLKLNLNKSKFFQKEIKLLGHIIQKNKIHPDKEKIETIQKIPLPETLTQLQSFLGKTNWLSKHLPKYSHITQPLRKVKTKKNGKHLIWNTEQIAAFEEIKHQLIHNTVPLTMMQPTSKISIETDASNVGLGAVLMADECQVAFWSSTLTSAQKKMPTILLELQAIRSALNKWKDLIYNKTVYIKTDNKPLAQAFLSTKHSKLKEQWIYDIQLFDIQVEHKPGSENFLADALSRNPNKYKPSTSDVNYDINPLFLMKSENFNLMETAHQQLGHAGYVATLSLLKRNKHKWPNMHQDVRNLVECCDKCQAFDTPPKIWETAKNAIPVTLEDITQIDLIEMEPDKNGYKYILDIMNTQTGFTILKPLKSKKASQIAKHLDSTIQILGPPKIIASDNGTEFNNNLIKELAKKWNFKMRFSTPYRPQGHGSIERNNGLIQTILKKITNGDTSNWSDKLTLTACIHNSRTSRRTGYTPNFLTLGKNWFPNDLQQYSDLTLILDKQEESLIQERAEKLQKMNTVIKPTAIEAIKENQQQIRETLDKKNKPTLTPLQPGDTVMLSNRQKNQKTDTPYLGPYQIKEQLPDGKYVLLDQMKNPIPNTYPRDMLKKVSSNNTVQQHNQSEIGYIRKILDYKENTDQFLVSFENLNEPIWINSDNLHNKNLKNKFLKKRKNKQKSQKR